MAHKTIIANWKMHLNPGEASRLLSRLDEHIKADKKVPVVLCPPFIDLYSVSKEVDSAKFKLGSQNLFYADEGAYTGEVSGAMLKDLVDYAIIGHSERRQFAGEDDKLIAKKVAAALRNGIKPVLCIGDTLMDRENGHATKVVIDQLTADLSQVTVSDLDDVLVAYEPVWAISTNTDAKPDKPDDVRPMVEAIRHSIEELFGEGAGSAAQILYGGSVSPHNARAFLELNGVDGALVGGASLNYEQFAAIVKTAQEIAE